MKETIFSKFPASGKFVLLLSLILLGLILSYFIIFIVVLIASKGDMSVISGITSDYSNPSGIFLMKIMQLITHIGMFIIPAIVFALFINKNFSTYLKINKKPFFRTIILCILIFGSVLPFLGFLIQINEMIVFPSFLKGIEAWMKHSEEQALKITEALLNVSTYRSYAFNIFLIAVIPAIGEEFIFRGCLQRLLSEWIKKSHLAVFITAFIFSAIHLQFYGFMPRLFLGLVLGYAFLWSGNLWYPIVLHFINNAFTVTAYFIKNKINISVETLEKSVSNNYLAVIISVVIFAILFYLFKNSLKNAIK